MDTRLLLRDRVRQGGRPITSTIISTDPVASWFLRERGITLDTLAKFGITWTDAEVAIPYPQGTKYRKGIPTGERTFFWKEGSKQTLFNMPATPFGEEVVFITEGETDAMRLSQELDGSAQVVGLPGINSWKADYAPLFAKATVYVVLDNDQDYKVSAGVDAAYLAIRRDIGQQVKRVRLPSDCKDVCEYFFKGYDLDDLRTLVTAAPSRFQTLDLSDAHVPRPVNWMVEGLIGQGDVSVMFGEPNVGKSWLSLSLALALVQGWETWLGLPLHNHGKVLYIDEENPEDEILRRLNVLGLRNSDIPNLRYLHDAGIRLDRDPDAVLDEALSFGPTLIVIDSQTRIHNKNENDAGEMAALFNDGIKPLARKTGATVLMMHHANKVTDGNAYRRMRGSVDIGAAYDTALEVKATGPGFLSVNQFKSRRKLPMGPIAVRLLDVEEGGREWVRLVTNVEAPPPF